MKSFLLGCLVMFAAALPVDSRSAGSPLFSSDAVIDLQLVVDLKDLCRPRETEGCDYTPTVLKYGGGEHSVPVEIKVRGGWRSLTRHCSVPLLWVRFDEQHTPGTPFEGQSLLPLSTHCGTGRTVEYLHTIEQITDSKQEQYVLLEYLGYRLYNLVTENSVRTRLVRMVYVDPDKPDRLVPYYAFFSEHFDSVAGRNDAERASRGSFDPDMLDMPSADLLALFQFMIGHTDWSIAREHNTALLRTGEGRLVPIPYDLDMSGLVNAFYAGPPPGLPIDSVLDRYYLGYCHAGADWEGLFEKFAGTEEAMLSLVGDIPGLRKTSARAARRYLAKFFEILGSEEKRDRLIVNACQPWPPS